MLSKTLFCWDGYSYMVVLLLLIIIAFLTVRIGNLYYNKDNCFLYYILFFIIIANLSILCLKSQNVILVLLLISYYSLMGIIAGHDISLKSFIFLTALKVSLDILGTYLSGNIALVWVCNPVVSIEFLFSVFIEIMEFYCIREGITKSKLFVSGVKIIFALIFSISGFTSMSGLWVKAAMQANSIVSGYLHSSGFIMLFSVLFYKFYNYIVNFYSSIFYFLKSSFQISSFMMSNYLSILCSLFIFSYLLFSFTVLFSRHNKSAIGFFSCAGVCYISLIFLNDPISGILVLFLVCFIKVFLFELQEIRKSSEWWFFISKKGLIIFFICFMVIVKFLYLLNESVYVLNFSYFLSEFEVFREIVKSPGFVSFSYFFENLYYIKKLIFLLLSLKLLQSIFYSRLFKIIFNYSYSYVFNRVGVGKKLLMSLFSFLIYLLNFIILWVILNYFIPESYVLWVFYLIVFTILTRGCFLKLLRFLITEFIESVLYKLIVRVFSLRYLKKIFNSSLKSLPSSSSKKEVLKFPDRILIYILKMLDLFIF